MQVVTSSIVRCSGMLTRTIANAQKRWDARDGILLVLKDDAGRIGVGEASPLPGFSSDTLSECTIALEQIERRLTAFDSDAAVADQLPLLLEGTRDVLMRTPSAQFALETALLDLIAQARGCSVAECLSNGAKPLERIECNGLMASRAPLESWPDEAVRIAALGLRTLKVKVGANPFAHELDALSKIADATDGRLTLRLDANGAWSVDEAREHLDACAHLPIEFVEQPVGVTALPSLGKCGVAWAADESLALPEMVEPLLSAPGCSAFVIKPALVGGLLAARELALRAQSSGLGVVVTHLFDGPVALLAGFELAASLPHAPRACGLDRHAGLAAWPHVAWPYEGPRGTMVSGPRQGLGIDRRALLQGLR